MNVSRIRLQHDGLLTRDMTWRLNEARTGIEVRTSRGLKPVSIALRWRLLMRRGTFFAPSDAGFKTWIVQAVTVPGRTEPVELQLEETPPVIADVLQRW